MDENSKDNKIEDKLEQMFAGIEDEQLVNTTPEEKNIPEPSNDSLKKYLNGCCNGADFNSGLLIGNSSKCDIFTSNNSLVPAKTTKKPKTKLSKVRKNKQLRDQKNLSIPKSKIYLKKMPTRRSLSIGISKELLKYSMKTNGEKNEKKNTSNDIKEEEGMTSLSLNLQTNMEDKQIKKTIPKNKNKNNNKTNSSKYQKKINYIRKFEFPIMNTKQNRQKIKHPRLQNLLSSENDTDEKQPKDIETKSRSPFVLLKNNGSIVVVNTVTPDDSNEKLTKQKKNSNYVYERKIIKGCHSSTLSNRYDADTADSSWKCVFCKIGPHKKDLGDLFGPYIISSNCDEYRTMKDYLEKFRNNDAQFLNFSTKTVKLVNEKSVSHIRNIFGCDYENININALGMSQVSVDCYEIWIHEECAIWAPNIFVVGSRLAGLEEATWNSMRYECTYCLKQGALLCCLQRDCKTACHVPCAIESKWLLDESKFWVYCRKHAFNKLLNKI